MRIAACLALAILVLGSLSIPVKAQTKKARAKNQPAELPDRVELDKMAARFAPTPLRVDTAGLSSGDRQALVKLIEAARILNDIFLKQLWDGNTALYARLQKDTSMLGKARLNYFWINKGPWSDIDQFKAFLPEVPPRKPPGANFYPENMTKDDFERWVAQLTPKEQDDAKSFFTIIRWKENSQSPVNNLIAIPYSEAYADDLTRAAGLLHEAAALTDNDSLKKFLNLRAVAFLSNNYYDSDMAWMDLDAPLDITIGPYETYNDELFGYKAAFEAYVNLRDDEETAKLSAFTAHLQDVENNLPMDAQYRNPKLGAAAPIRVVDEILSAGDGAHGVKTAAYNLPNDDRVVQQKGSKRVMLKNVQEAKFRSVLLPIARRMLTRDAMVDVSFEPFFTHILAHELMHGLGPHQIRVGDRDSTPREELKGLYGAIEECKADVTGLFALQYMMDHAKEVGLSKVLPSDDAAQRQLYTTYLASSFRTLRFGLNDAHGKGMAVQFNTYTDKGGFIQHDDGTFSVNVAKMKTAVAELDHDLLTIEAQGDYSGAKKLLDELGVVRPALQKALDSLQGIPTDIEPIFVTAEELAPTQPAPPQPIKSRSHRGRRH
ncbi:MAG: dipeptidyl-peptidase 3 family protein [Terriglobales bacterium]